MPQFLPEASADQKHRMKNPDLLSADHEELDGLLKTVFERLKLSKAAPLYESLDLFWARLAIHIRAEHLHLFPALKKAKPSIRATIQSLKNDHDRFMSNIARAIVALRGSEGELSDETLWKVGEIVRGVAARLEKHNLIEETEIYPLLYSELTADDAEEIVGLMKKELQNMPRRFKDQDQK